MALNYVDIDTQKNYSQILHDGRDNTIQLLIQSASAQVKNYLGDFSPYEAQRNDDDDYIVDSNHEPVADINYSGDPILKAEVKLAVMILVDMRLWPERHKDVYTGQGRLPPVVESLLYPLRDPALR